MSGFKLLGVSLLLGTFAASGCGNWGGKRYDPEYWHENFVNSIVGKVGHNFDKLGGGWTAPESLVNTTTLQNGYVEYTYSMSSRKVKVSCQYTFVVNHETRIIVAARWEGEKRDCILVP